MKKKIFFITAFGILLIGTFLYGQNKLPREYVPPEELVSFNSDIDLAIALDILSEYAIQYLQKPIYDPDKRSGAIGIDIRSLSWKKALGLILSRRGLWYVEKPRFFEVVSADKMEATQTSESSSKLPDDINLKPNSREIKIETIFFEGDRKAIKELGIDWNMFYRGKVNINSNQAGALQLTDDIFNANVKIPKSLIGVDIDVLLSAFDSNNLGKVLAQPQVVVTEGNQGTIQVGQDFSIKTRDFAGNVIDKFFSTGTILNVTPYIIDEKCTSCGTCVKVCPVTPKAVDYHNGDQTIPPVHHYDLCIRCYCCQEMCPSDAIEVQTPLPGRLIRR